MAKQQWFVFRDDDYADNGGIGMSMFADKGEALKFITDRIGSKHFESTVANYQLIQGNMVGLKAVEFATRIEIEDD